MGKSKVFGPLINRTEGSVAVITAIALVALLGVVSLAIDMGQLYTVRNELQNVADAAALAGAGNLIQDYGAGAVRDAEVAKAKVMEVVQRQSQLSGQPAVEAGDRNDVTIDFGAWNIYTGDPSTAWTEIGSTCASDSNANAVKINIKRTSGTVYGPVTNIFAGFMGFNTSEIKAVAIAYLGYTEELPTGGVQVPLALPTSGQDSPLACRAKTGWFASLFTPREAVADGPKTITFKDTGGANVSNNVPTSPTASLDANQGYWYTGASNNSVPTTITNTLAKIYTPSLSGSSSAPAVLPDLKVGQQIYPRSEYPWGRNYIGSIFKNLQKAYNYKTTGNANTAPAAGTAWRTTLVVHGLMNTASLPQKTGFMSLARLLNPFWAKKAWACSTISYPTVKVSTFVNVDITGVTYNDSSSDDGSYSYPKTINHVTYNNKKDFLTRYPNSTWNLNTVTIKTVTGSSTITPGGSLSGGPSSNTVNPGAPTNVGSFASIPCLVK